MEKQIMISGYFVKNIGDDLFLEVLIQEIPDIHFNILVDYPENGLSTYYESFHNISVVRESIIKRLTKYLPVGMLSVLFKLIHRKLDVFILLGGSIFIEGKNHVRLLKHRRFDESISKHTFVIGSNFGPYKDKIFFAEYSQFLSRIDSVSWRDYASYNLFKDSDIKQHLLPDVVLGLDVPVHKELVVANKYILINIMKLPRGKFDEIHEQQYIEILKKTTKRYLDLGYEVHILSVNAADGDLSVANAFKKRWFLNDNKVQVVQYENISKALKEVEFANEIVATRYHVMILSWLYRKPVHVLAYSNKVTDFIATWNAVQKYTDLRELKHHDVELLKKDFSVIEDNRLGKLHVKAKQHFLPLKEIITHSNSKS